MNAQDPEQSGSGARLAFVESTFRDTLSKTHGESADPTLLPKGDDDVDLSSAERIASLAATRTHTRYVLEGELGRGGMGAVLVVRGSCARTSRRDRCSAAPEWAPRDRGAP